LDWLIGEKKLFFLLHLDAPSPSPATEALQVVFRDLAAKWSKISLERRSLPSELKYDWLLSATEDCYFGPIVCLFSIAPSKQLDSTLRLSPYKILAKQGKNFVMKI
jgi:hypothetical protein